MSKRTAQITLPPNQKNGGSPSPLSKNQRKRRNRRKKKRSPQMKMGSQPLTQVTARVARFHLSECSRLYLQALTNPFGVQAGQACIPDLNDIPSFKTLVIARGTFNVGANQFGFILLNPSAGGNSATNVTFSLAGYLATQLPNASGATVGVGVLTQMPYATAQLVNAGGVLHRTVGCGLRIRYTGTELNRSGRIIPYRSNNVRNAQVASHTTSNFLSRPEVPSDACDRRWHIVTYLPTTTFISNANDDCYGYVDGSTESIDPTTLRNGDLGFIVDGANAGNGFEWEAYYHKEYVSSDGVLQPSGVTSSHSDITGLSAVRDATEGTMPSGDGPSYYKQVVDTIRDYAPSDVSHVVDTFVKGANAARQFGFL